MTVVPAWQLPGGDGDVVVMPAGLPHLRIYPGPYYPARTVIVIAKLDNLSQVDRGVLWCARRTANDSPNHGLVFEPNNNNIEKQYATSLHFEWGANSETSTTEWVGYCYIDAGLGGNLTIRRIPIASGAQTHSATLAPDAALSDYSDEQPQTYTLGAIFNGSLWLQELDGQIAFFLVLNNVALSQAQCEAFCLSPLINGDLLVQAHGNNCYFWDDSGSDIGGNHLGSPTYSGAASRVAGIGPDVPARITEPVGTYPSVLSVGPLNDTVYDGEERVLLQLATAGTTQPLVHLTSDPNGVVNQRAQTVFSWNSGTQQLRIHMSLGAGTGGLMYLFVTNQTVGSDFGLRGSKQVVVNSNPGVNTIALRTTVPSQIIASGAAYSLALAPYVYHPGSQEPVAGYSVTGAPPGLSMGATTGILAGTLTAGAETASPYLTKPRLTDANGAFAEQTYSHAVSPEVIEPPPPEPEPGEPTERTPGSWGLRGRQST